MSILRKKSVKKCKGEKITVAGDGRYFSAGFISFNCLYLIINIILGVEAARKRKCFHGTRNSSKPARKRVDLCQESSAYLDSIRRLDLLNAVHNLIPDDFSARHRTLTYPQLNQPLKMLKSSWQKMLMCLRKYCNGAVSKLPTLPPVFVTVFLKHCTFKK